jgi:hypothetical protein
MKANPLLFQPARLLLHRQMVVDQRVQRAGWNLQQPAGTPFEIGHRVSPISSELNGYLQKIAHTP